MISGNGLYLVVQLLIEFGGYFIALGFIDFSNCSVFAEFPFDSTLFVVFPELYENLALDWCFP